MSKQVKLLAPFIWFGGKSKAASLIWSRLGTDIGNYVEPFAGSLAALLNVPPQFNGWKTVNDLDGNIANFWRAVQDDPEAVAFYACSPVNEIELHARHAWLVQNLPLLASRLMGDPSYCEPRTAGWWAWGLCSWIGHGWCSGQGPWSIVDTDDGRVLARTGAGMVPRQLPHLGNGGQGVNKQLPHLGDGGQGVNRPVAQDRLAWLTDWMNKLHEALGDARITCGDWERVCSVGTMTRNGACGVLMDPPYSLTDAVYAHDSSTVSGDVRAWCAKHGNNPDLRIALCGHAGEGHEELLDLGWSVETWAKGGGYQGKDDRERIWFSPHCIKQDSLF